MPFCCCMCFLCTMEVLLKCMQLHTIYLVQFIQNQVYFPCHERPPVLRDHIIQWSLYTGLTIRWLNATQYYTQLDKDHSDGLLQDCSNSSVLAIELLQSCTKPSIEHWSNIWPLWHSNAVAHFMNHLSLVIQIQWKIGIASSGNKL